MRTIITCFVYEPDHVPEELPDGIGGTFTEDSQVFPNARDIYDTARNAFQDAFYESHEKLVRSTVPRHWDGVELHVNDDHGTDDVRVEFEPDDDRRRIARGPNFSGNPTHLSDSVLEARLSEQYTETWHGMILDLAEARAAGTRAAERAALYARAGLSPAEAAARLATPDDPKNDEPLRLLAAVRH